MNARAGRALILASLSNAPRKLSTLSNVFYHGEKIATVLTLLRWRVPIMSTRPIHRDRMAIVRSPMADACWKGRPWRTFWPRPPEVIFARRPDTARPPPDLVDGLGLEAARS